MGRTIKVPIIIGQKDGVPVTDIHRETNSDDANRILLALKKAPDGFMFTKALIMAFKERRWEPPVRPVPVAPSPETEPKERPPSVIAEAVQNIINFPIRQSTQASLGAS